MIGNCACPPLYKTSRIPLLVSESMICWLPSLVVICRWPWSIRGSWYRKTNARFPMTFLITTSYGLRSQSGIVRPWKRHIPTPLTMVFLVAICGISTVPALPSPCGASWRGWRLVRARRGITPNAGWTRDLGEHLQETHGFRSHQIMGSLTPFDLTHTHTYVYIYIHIICIYCIYIYSSDGFQWLHARRSSAIYI